MLFRSQMTRVSRILKRITSRQRSGLDDDLPAKYGQWLNAVNYQGEELRSLSESRLQERARRLKSRAKSGESLEELLIDAFALVREIAARVINLRPYDVQIIGGFGLHEGKIVEMQTGEGKTLAAVAPACLNALRGQGVHVLTFNDYLAHRDASWMGPIYRFLGLSVGYIQQGMGQEQRKKAYSADVTYVTAKEAGFDLLRDGLVYDPDDLVQRPFHMALVDEADSILIDEARIPLVIAGETTLELVDLELMNTAAALLVQGVHYIVDQDNYAVYLTDEGADYAEKLIECGALFSPENINLLTELNLALQAKELVKRDVDYIVREGRVLIVDTFTGRTQDDRHWPHGLQSAVEAKEGLKHSSDARILNMITVQNFLRRYPLLCGMTGTAQSAADELHRFYNLDVLVLPPNRPCLRIDFPDIIFSNRAAKNQAILSEIVEVHQSGRPILVGTLTVEESESLASDLMAIGVSCNILNAKHDEREARIVAEAGDVGAVTISTNMAGRGTDIKLGGSAGERRERVLALGGLYVIGTNRHESIRIDRQLRGRAGRQGDPGSSCFMVSLEDDLILRHGIGSYFPERLRSDNRFKPLDNPLAHRMLAWAQRVIEGQNSDIRHTLWRYSSLIEDQRQILSARRQLLLWSEESPSLFRQSMPSARMAAAKAVGESRLVDLERRLILQSIDQCWSEHLERMEDVRESIHLVGVGGLDPLIEFQKQAAESFEIALATIDDRALRKFTALDLSGQELDLDTLGLWGPSSTWTYVISEHGAADQLASSLAQQRNIGFAVGAALMWPLLIVWPVLRRWKKIKHS